MRSPLRVGLSPIALDDVREGCAWVAARAKHVRIDPEGLAAFAAAVPRDELGRDPVTRFPERAREPEALAGFVLALDAINFGSGYFPHLHKLPGLSGYRTVEAHLVRHVDASGPLTPDALRAIGAAEFAELLHQPAPGAEPAVDELLGLYARAWRDLGNAVARRGTFLDYCAAADGSAEGLIQLLLEMPLYRDRAPYAGREVAFLKRAQLTAADLNRALPDGAGALRGLEQLTLFADNLVPHVLRLDGVLVYTPELVARIARGEGIPWGSEPEVEIRACALHAVEQLSAVLDTAPLELDYWLWARGAEPAYKAVPRHRTRCTFY